MIIKTNIIYDPSIIKTKIIYDEGIIARRKEKKFRGRSLWHYANVYFQARNPMLFRVIKEYTEDNIVVLQISPDILNISDVGITDGNGASQDTVFFENIDEGLSKLEKELLDKGHWIDIHDGKRKIMAEALVPNKISKDNIMSIYTHSQNTSDSIKEQLRKVLNNIPVISHPWMFFRPKFQQGVSNKITLVKEDMFFSKMQTFTISVNTVGVMGKGLASRAKYQFPGVYVVYQDLCRTGKLKMGTPYLYKNPESIDKTLMEDSSSSTKEERQTFFLLFPTKNHWRKQSPIDGIEKGLQWLLENYKAQGIKSLALPALGCGLGGLDWKEVGPLICKYLNQMEIQSCIYLPLEKELPPEQLKPEFLLKE